MKAFYQFIVGAVLFLVPFLYGSAQAQSPGQSFSCQNGGRTWTLYESSQPRMFHEEISVQGPGTFTVTMQANGFGFEGFAYTRRTAWDKWQYVMKTNKGKRRWQQTWRVFGDEQRLGLLQLIKDDAGCRGCTLTMKMSTSNCKKPAQRQNTRKHCDVNQCWNGSDGGLYGLDQTCVAYAGWDGGRCPK